MIHLDTSFLIRALVRRSPQDKLLRALRANMLETLRPLKLVWKAEEDQE